MTVAELIAILQAQPQDMQVAYRIHSEYSLLCSSDIETRDLCEARPDGWIHARRPDKPTQTYLLIS